MKTNTRMYIMYVCLQSYLTQFFLELEVLKKNLVEI